MPWQQKQQQEKHLKGGLVRIWSSSNSRKRSSSSVSFLFQVLMQENVTPEQAH
jgi:hypothetical protein